MKTTAILVLLLAGAVHAQSMNLLGVTSSMPVTEKIAAPAGPDAFSITMLARVIAAEAGGNYFSTLKAKTCVGAAMVNQIKIRFHVAEAKAAHIQQILIHQPGFLSSWRSKGLHKFYTHDAAWFRASGYSQCLDAAQAALAGADPSMGATNWYDNTIAMPAAARQGVVTGHIKTAGPTLVFYRHAR